MLIQTSRRLSTSRPSRSSTAISTVWRGLACTLSSSVAAYRALCRRPDSARQDLGPRVMMPGQAEGQTDFGRDLLHSCTPPLSPLSRRLYPFVQSAFSILTSRTRLYVCQFLPKLFWQLIRYEPEGPPLLSLPRLLLRAARCALGLGAALNKGVWGRGEQGGSYLSLHRSAISAQLREGCFSAER